MTESTFSQLIEENSDKLQIKYGSIVSAMIEEINNKFVIVNAGLKSDSFIDINEF